MWRPSYYSNCHPLPPHHQPRHPQISQILPPALALVLLLGVHLTLLSSRTSFSPAAAWGRVPVIGHFDRAFLRHPSYRHRPLLAETEASPFVNGGEQVPKHMTSITFASMPLSSPLQASLSRMGLIHATDIQLACIRPALEGLDVIGQGRTGTGKTMAFLIPMVERLLREPPDERFVSAVVLSPTRELASQTHSECLKLVQGTGLKVMDMIGGTKVWDDLHEARRGVDIIVATPGRMWDLMKNHDDVRRRLQYVRMVVLDEMDRLLDYGFWKDVETILKVFPIPANRQTLLFSATIPVAVLKAADIVTRVNTRQIVRTVKENEAFVHDHVMQEAVVTPLEDQLKTLLAVLREEMRPRYFKVLVFFPTARLTQFYADVFVTMGIRVMEMHSAKGPVHRTKVSDQFMKLRNVVMFSSDVSARGMDYPGVTCVIQVGIPPSEDTYVHRLGRTGRGKNTAGRGVLLLADFEVAMLQRLEPCGLKQVQPPESREGDEALVKSAVGKLGRRPQELEEVYLSWLGFYKTMVRFHEQPIERLVEIANACFPWLFSAEGPPAIDATLAGRMRIKFVPGIVLRNETAGSASHAGSS
eukprot:GGOE01022796.1.p1 GENE.GGOE01022796.1~~GGOE01022796.1.p1  ORF type:complete len:594 (+),score=157.47 GGOE01022796.1:27-1784(+)